MRPKSEIYTRKRDDEHPHPFHLRSSPPPPGFLRSASGKYHFALKLSKISSILSEMFQSLDVRSWSQANFLDAISFQKLCRFSLHDRKKCDRKNPTKGKQINKSFIHYRHLNGRIQLARLPTASARLFESVLNVLLSPNLVLHKAKICMEPTSHVKSNYFLH